MSRKDGVDQQALALSLPSFHSAGADHYHHRGMNGYSSNPNSPLDEHKIQVDVSITQDVR
jgi:hypothetical protein